MGEIERGIKRERESRRVSEKKRDRERDNGIGEGEMLQRVQNTKNVTKMNKLGLYVILTFQVNFFLCCITTPSHDCL